MPELEREVRLFKISYNCDKCGQGDMLPTGLTLTSNPPQYPHICDVCGHKQTFKNKSYPIIVHRKV